MYPPLSPGLVACIAWCKNFSRDPTYAAKTITLVGALFPVILSASTSSNINIKMASWDGNTCRITGLLYGYIQSANCSKLWYRWVSARKTKLQCVSNGVTSFLHYAFDIFFVINLKAFDKHCCVRWIETPRDVIVMHVVKLWDGHTCRITGLLCGRSTAPVDYKYKVPVLRSSDHFLGIKLNKFL